MFVAIFLIKEFFWAILTSESFLLAYSCNVLLQFWNWLFAYIANTICRIWIMLWSFVFFSNDFYWWKSGCKWCRVHFRDCEFSYDETRCHGCWKILNTQYICMTSLQNELRDGMILCFCCIICSTRAAFDLFFLRLVSLLLMIFQCVQATENL